MAHIKVPEGMPGIRALLAFRPETEGPLRALADALLHAPNSLSQADRELIAAYVSWLNDCTYCHRSHSAIAAHLLNDEQLVASVMDGPHTAAISPKLKALLAIAAHVQQSGRAVHRMDIERARGQGATDIEIHDTVLIAATFCMFNRYVDGLAAWTPEDPDGYRERARLVAEHGYAAPVSLQSPSSRP